MQTRERESVSFPNSLHIDALFVPTTSSKHNTMITLRIRAINQTRLRIGRTNAEGIYSQQKKGKC